MENLKSKLVKKQVSTHTKTYTENGNEYKIKLHIRYDDQCGNGHNSFAMTADIYELNKRGNWKEYSFGCQHKQIKKIFPEYAKYIKWHLMGSDGPTHYIANTLYHARDIDHNGLKKGEFQSFIYKVIVNGKSLYNSRIFYSFRNWLHRDEAKQQAQDFLSNIKPELLPEIQQHGYGKPSEGKKIDLDAARSSAIWPEATIEQLQNKELLEKRLPELMVKFKKGVEKLGFIY